MNGVGIRYYELAKALSEHADVTIAAGRMDYRDPTDYQEQMEIPVVPYRQQEPDVLRPLIEAADTVIARPQWPIVSRWLRRAGPRLIFDLYDPEGLELLAGMSGVWSDRRLSISQALVIDRLSDALRDGHHFVCAGDRQRDLWLGAMLAERLIQPGVYRRDPTLRSLIDVVAFGLPVEPPVRTRPEGLRQKFPQIGPDAEIVLWNGGIWPWLDPSTAMRAMALLERRRPQARLVFMGAPSVPEMRVATDEARRLAAELDLLERTVYFNDQWVPYRDRANWLLDADCAVSSHYEHIETRFAFRTRLLDCFWAGLPIVCTRGDELSDMVERQGLGATVDQGDPEQLAEALDRVLARGRTAYARGLRGAAERHAWPVVAAPLVGFIEAPFLPPRLGERLGGSLAKRPAHRLRNNGYRVVRRGLNLVGSRRWPPV